MRYKTIVFKHIDFLKSEINLVEEDLSAGVDPNNTKYYQQKALIYQKILISLLERLIK